MVVKAQQTAVPSCLGPCPLRAEKSCLDRCQYGCPLYPPLAQACEEPEAADTSEDLLAPVTGPACETNGPMALSGCCQMGARYAHLPARGRTRIKRRRGMLPIHTRGAMMM